MNTAKKNHFIRARWDFIEKIENSTKPFSHTLAVFALIVFLRIVLESLERGIPLTHAIFFSFWISIALSFIIIFALAAKLTPMKTSRIVLPFFIIIILPIIADYIVTFGKGAQICFFNFTDFAGIFFSFVTFGGPFMECGVTLGIRLETLIVLMLSAYYIYTKTKNSLRTAISVFGIYCIMFAYNSIPGIIQIIIGPFGGNFESPLSTQLLVGFYLFLILIQAIVILFLTRKSLFLAIARDMRLLRLAHFLGMFVFGVFVGLKFGGGFSFENKLGIFFSCASLVLAFIFSVIQNNIADVKIDNRSNKNRPLQSSGVVLREYSAASISFFFLSLGFAALSGVFSFYVAAGLCMLFLLYSHPPMRLKQIPFFSKFIIGLGSMLCTLWGFALANVNLTSFPLPLAVLILAGFSLAINFIDIKDFAGDKAGKIKTLVTILGPKKAKLLIGFFFIIAYALAYLVLNKLVLLPVIIGFAGLEFFLINKKTYDERLVLLAYLVSFVILAAQY